MAVAGMSAIVRNRITGKKSSHVGGKTRRATSYLNHGNPDFVR
jgi:hypothetical protein